MNTLTKPSYLLSKTEEAAALKNAVFTLKQDNITFVVQSGIPACTCRDNEQRHQAEQLIDDICSGRFAQKMFQAENNVAHNKGQNHLVVATHKLFEEMGLCIPRASLLLYLRSSALKPSLKPKMNALYDSMCNKI